MPVEVDRLNVIAQWQDSFYVAAHVARFYTELYARIERNQRIDRRGHAARNRRLPPSSAGFAAVRCIGPAVGVGRVERRRRVGGGVAGGGVRPVLLHILTALFRRQL